MKFFHGLLPTMSLICALVTSNSGPFNMPAKWAQSPGHCPTPLLKPAAVNAPLKPEAAETTCGEAPGSNNTNTPETAPIPVQVHVIGFQPALNNPTSILLERSAASGEESTTKTSIGIGPNVEIAADIPSICACDKERGASCCSIFIRASLSCSATLFASAADCSAFATCSRVCSITRFEYSSLTLPIQTTTTVEIAPKTSATINAKFAQLYKKQAVSTDGHMRFLAALSCFAISAILLIGFWGLYIMWPPRLQKRRNLFKGSPASLPPAPKPQ